jgi:hypothetical protein
MTLRNLVLAFALLAGCAKNDPSPAAPASSAAVGSCTLTCEGKAVACKDDVAADACTAEKKATTFEAVPKCPHEIVFAASARCP